MLAYLFLQIAMVLFTQTMAIEESEKMNKNGLSIDRHGFHEIMFKARQFVKIGLIGVQLYFAIWYH